MFLEHPPTSEPVDVAFATDLQNEGYVMNLTRLWSWRPDVADTFGDARDVLLAECELTDADVALLVAATAAARSDSYCSLAWGRRLAKHVGPDAAASVVAGGLDGGLSDRAIFEATAHIAFRLAFSTVNDALGAAPDAQVAEAAPDVLREAVTFGRPPDRVPS